MNYLYLNNPVPQPLPRTFVFNKRNERIDWRRIGTCMHSIRKDIS